MTAIRGIWRAGRIKWIGKKNHSVNVSSSPRNGGWQSVSLIVCHDNNDDLSHDLTTFDSKIDKYMYVYMCFYFRWEDGLARHYFNNGLIHFSWMDIAAFWQHYCAQQSYNSTSTHQPRARIHLTKKTHAVSSSCNQNYCMMSKMPGMLRVLGDAEDARQRLPYRYRL